MTQVVPADTPDADEIRSAGSEVEGQVTLGTAQMGRIAQPAGRRTVQAGGRHCQ